MDVCLGGSTTLCNMYAPSDRLRKDKEGGGEGGGGSRGSRGRRREKQDEDEDEEQQDVERLATRMPSPKFNQGSEVVRSREPSTDIGWEAHDAI